MGDSVETNVYDDHKAMLEILDIVEDCPGIEIVAAFYSDFEAAHFATSLSDLPTSGLNYSRDIRNNRFKFYSSATLYVRGFPDPAVIKGFQANRIYVEVPETPKEREICRQLESRLRSKGFDDYRQLVYIRKVGMSEEEAERLMRPKSEVSGEGLTAFKPNGFKFADDTAEKYARIEENRIKEERLFTQESLERAKKALNTQDPKALYESTDNGREPVETNVSNFVYGGFRYATKKGGSEDGLKCILPILIESASDSEMKDAALRMLIDTFPSIQWENRGYCVIRKPLPTEPEDQPTMLKYEES